MGKGDKGVVLKLPKEGPDGRDVCPLERPSKRGAASPGEGLGDCWPRGGSAVGHVHSTTVKGQGWYKWYFLASECLTSRPKGRSFSR